MQRVFVAGKGSTVLTETEELDSINYRPKTKQSRWAWRHTWRLYFGGQVWLNVDIFKCFWRTILGVFVDWLLSVHDEGAHQYSTAASDVMLSLFIWPRTALFLCGMVRRHGTAVPRIGWTHRCTFGVSFRATLCMLKSYFVFWRVAHALKPSVPLETAFDVFDVFDVLVSSTSRHIS